MAALLAVAVGLSLLVSGTSRQAPLSSAPLIALNTPTTTPASSAASAPLPLRDSDDALGLLGKPAADTSKVLWRSLASVVVIGVLLWAGLKGFKKLLPKISVSSGKHIRVQETLFLAPGKSVHLLTVGTRTFLVAASRDGLSMLGDVTGALRDGVVPPAAPEEPAP